MSIKTMPNHPASLALSMNNPQILATKVQDMPELKAVGNPTGTNQYTPEEERKGYNSNNSSQRGTSSEYRTRKLKRDHPEVFERMLAGEFATVTQAEEAAGIKKPSDRWNAPGPVEKLADIIKKRYSETQTNQLIELLRKESHE